MPRIEKENCISISIYDLRRLGLLNGYTSGIMSWGDGTSQVSYEIDTTIKNAYLKLTFSAFNIRTGKVEATTDYYPLLLTDCNYGGKRLWIRCLQPTHANLRGADRVAKLYLPPGAVHFACRHCYRLTYHLRNKRNDYSLFASEEYAAKIKRWHYAGKPTRKHKRYRQIEEKSDEGIDNL